VRSERDRPPSTLLEWKIRERGMTLDEFVQYADEFARENGERGTISTRHLQRLISPRERPTSLRPATRRLLEAILGASIVELLGPPLQPDGDRPARHTDAQDVPSVIADWQREAAEVDRLVALSARVDQETVNLLASQVENTRRLDRRFGASTLLSALRLHAEHIEQLLTHTTDTHVRRSLAAVLVDAHTLAGWQSLDRGEVVTAWWHYGRACDAALIAESTALHAHALAKQAVVLSDVGRITNGVAMSSHARSLGGSGTAMLRAWLAAAHGEALAAAGMHAASLRAFDEAAAAMPHDRATGSDGNPYIGLDDVHLARWRGHALARLGDPEAVPVLTRALRDHDAEFTRAEAALRVDLTLAHLAANNASAAHEQRRVAVTIINAAGSVRQRHRLLVTLERCVAVRI
jgi:hypothetical protein